MLKKIAFIILAFSASFLIQWYGNFTGKLPAKGTYLGLAYDSIFMRSVVTQFEYLWVLIIINILFTFGFQLGFASFKNFLPVAIIWLAMGPIASLIFNAVILKERVSPLALGGIILIIIGSIFVTAHKEIAALIK